MKVYIQKFNGEIANDNAYIAYLGFDHERVRDKEIKIKFFEDIDDIPIKPDEYGHQPLVVGFIEDTIKYFERCGIQCPVPLSIPDELNSEYFLGRKIQKMTLGEFKKGEQLPIFVKSESKIKVFRSGVIKEKSSRKTLFEFDDYHNPINEDLIVLTSDVVDMISEYRCFIKEGNLIDIRHYMGDCTFYPDIPQIYDMIKAYKSAPKAYSLDVAVIKVFYNDIMNKIMNSEQRKFFYKTVLIECQDMWAIGPYGLDPVTYVSMLKKRWYEIFRNNKNSN